MSIQVVREHTRQKAEEAIVMLEVTQQKAKEALILLEVEGTEALRRQKNREGYALASLLEEKNKAEAVRNAADVSPKTR